jgi:hypothetical protein
MLKKSAVTVVNTAKQHLMSDFGARLGMRLGLSGCIISDIIL